MLPETETMQTTALRARYDRSYQRWNRAAIDAIDGGPYSPEHHRERARVRAIIASARLEAWRRSVYQGAAR